MVEAGGHYGRERGRAVMEVSTTAGRVSEERKRLLHLSPNMVAWLRERSNAW